MTLIIKKGWCSGRCVKAIDGGTRRSFRDALGNIIDKKQKFGMGGIHKDAPSPVRMIEEDNEH
jgi:hypothetical protein